MGTPRISVIIPVYNVEPYLQQCLDSVCAQTMRDIEIICVDDGSTDGSLRILQDYVERDSRIKLLVQDNQGAGVARNYGLREAKGQYLSFLDADDFFEPEMLEEAHHGIEQYKADFVVFGSDQYYMDSKEFIRNPWVLRMRDIPPYMPFTHRELTDNIFKTFVGWAWDKLYRRSFVEHHHLWFQEQRTTNDMLFVFSALVLAKKIAVVDKVLAHQRRGSGSSLSVTREKSWYCFFDALLALRSRLQEERVYWELEQDYINYALHFSLWNLKTLAEPTRKMLYEKLCNEWFAALGIDGKTQEYFYNQREFELYVQMAKKDYKNKAVKV